MFTFICLGTTLTHQRRSKQVLKDGVPPREGVATVIVVLDFAIFSPNPLFIVVSACELVYKEELLKLLT